MCRWHKLAAKSVAMDITNDGFDVGRYSIALVAMGTQRVEQNEWGLKELHSIDGFNPEELLTPECQNAFQNSAAYTDLSVEEVEERLNAQISILNNAMDDLQKQINISKEDLKITDRITRDGYKTTCCAEPNPRENGPQLDAAVVYLVGGYDNEQRDYASQELTLLTRDEFEALKDDPTIPENDRGYLPDLDNIRDITEKYLQQDGVIDALRRSFALSVAYIFKTAKSDLDNGTGLTGASDCIMCEGTKGRSPR